MTRADLGVVMGQSAADTRRRRGEGVLGIAFLRKRAAGGHPLDTAESVQVEEGFDDLGNACGSIRVSLVDSRVARRAFLSSQELANLRKLEEELRVRKGVSQEAEVEGDWTAALRDRRAKL